MPLLLKPLSHNEARKKLSIIQDLNKKNSHFDVVFGRKSLPKSSSRLDAVHILENHTKIACHIVCQVWPHFFMFFPLFSRYTNMKNEATCMYFLSKTIH